MDRSRWRKLIKDVWWSGWMWVGDCFFWYWPTRVVPDKGLLDGCVNKVQWQLPDMTEVIGGHPGVGNRHRLTDTHNNRHTLIAMSQAQNTKQNCTSTTYSYYEDVKWPHLPEQNSRVLNKWQRAPHNRQASQFIENCYHLSISGRLQHSFFSIL